MRKLFLYVLIASVAVSAGLGIIVVVVGNFGEFEGKVLATSATVTVTSILGLACGAFLETGRGRNIPIVGIAMSVVSAALLISIIWAGEPESEWFTKTVASTTLLAFASSLISLLSLARLEPRFIWSHQAAHLTVWTLSGLLLFLIWLDPTEWPELLTRTIAVLSICIAAITVVTPVFHKLSRHEATKEEIDEEIERLNKRIEELEKQKEAATA